MAMTNMSKSVVRTGKNYLKGFTNTQVKVRDATSNDPWGPSGTQMNELAQLSFNQNDFIEMMEIMDKRLNDKGKNWRHVFKTLTLLDYLLHAGSENVVIYFRDNIYIIKTLKEFQYVDDYGKDQGANVRQKAKDITNLLQDEARLREERRSRAHMRDRLSDGPAGPSNNNDFEDEEGKRRRQEAENRRRAGQNREDDELRRAIEESKRMATEEQERIRREATDEDELQRALALSREEEEKRIRELEKKNETALFDDDFNFANGPSNQYANQQQSDMWGNPIYGMQQQYTSFNPYLQQQQTSFNPFFQQQMALQAQQEAEYQRQMELQMAAQQYQHMMTQQQMPQQPIQPQPTAFGSNNPFAFSQTNQQQQQPQQPPRQPQLEMSMPASSSVPIGDLLGGDENEATTPKPAVQQPVQQSSNKFTNDPRFKDLDRMLASGDGIDTFGNTGDLRFGHSQARTQAVNTQNTGAPGNNPFFKV
jgi:epsin